MKKRLSFSIAAILFVAVLVSSCSGVQSVQKEEKYTIGVVTKSSTSEYWMSLCEGAKKASEEYGMDVIFLQPDSETSKEAQIKMVETLAKKKVDIIALSPVDSQNASEYLEAASENNVPVICYDDEFESYEVPYIGIDNEKAGYELMKYLAEQMDHKGEVGIISGRLSQKCHRLRIEGAKRYLEEEPNMKLAYLKSGYSNLQMRENEIDQLKQKYPMVRGVMVTSASTAMGFIDAVSDKDMKIVSVDAQTDALTALKEGRISALIAQSGYEVGYETVRYIAEFRKTEILNKDKMIEAQLLTLNNVEEYLQLKE